MDSLNSAFHHCHHYMTQAEDSSFQPILSEEDISQIYQRILDTEIEVAGQSQSQGSGSVGKAGSSAQNLKLAAAMGLTQIMLPFRSVRIV